METTIYLLLQSLAVGIFTAYFKDSLDETFIKRSQLDQINDISKNVLNNLFQKYKPDTNMRRVLKDELYSLSCLKEGLVSNHDISIQKVKDTIFEGLGEDYDATLCDIDAFVDEYYYEVKRQISITPDLQMLITNIRLDSIIAHIERNSLNVTKAQDWWSDWASLKDKEIATSLMLASRESIFKEIEEKLNTTKVVNIKANTQDEAIAFIIAYLKQKHPEKVKKTYLLEDKVIFDQYADNNENQILIISNSFNPTKALANNNIIIKAHGWSGNQISMIQIPMTKRMHFCYELEQMGFETNNAHELANKVHSNISVFRRYMLETIEPEWTRLDFQKLKPFIFIGSWDVQNKPETLAVEELFQKNKEAVEEILQQFTNRDDPPVRKIGNVWQLVYREEAWVILYPFVTPALYNRFERVAINALTNTRLRDRIGEINVVDNAEDIRLSFRNSLSNNIAILALLDQRRAENLVSKILNDDVLSWEFVLNFRDWTLIAEAAPEIFLSFVLKLTNVTEEIRKVFSPEGNYSAGGYSNFLFAFDLLSNSKTYVKQVCLTIAKIINKGVTTPSNYVNSPLNSLYTYFTIWYPQTPLNFEERMDVIKEIYLSYPDVCWKLLVMLFPKRMGGAVSNKIKPNYRDDWNYNEHFITNKDIFDQYKAIESYALEVVDDNLVRWKELLEHSEEFEDTVFDEVCTIFCEKIEYGRLNGDFSEMRKVLRNIISENTRFKDAQWAATDERIGKYEVLLNKLPKTSISEDLLWMFSNEIFYSFYDHENYEENIKNKIGPAIEEFYSEFFFDGIMTLVDKIDLPDKFGFVLNLCSFRNDMVEAMLESYLNCPDKSGTRICASSFLGFYIANNIDWIKELIETSKYTELDKAKVLLLLRYDEISIAFIKQLTADVAIDYYWGNVSSMYFWWFSDRDALVNLYRQNRYLDIIDITYHLLRDKKEFINDNLDLIFSSMESLPGADDKSKSGSLSEQYKLLKIFEYFYKLDDKYDDVIAGLEWQYLSIWNHDGYPKLLTKKILSNPDEFVKIVDIVFKGEHESARTFVSDEEKEKFKSIATNCYYLLDSLSNVSIHNNPLLIPDHLTEWVKHIEVEMEKKDKLNISQQIIGKCLVIFNDKEEGLLKYPEILASLEPLIGNHIKVGFEIGVRNKRGVTSRAILEGGQQERKLADHYGNIADKMHKKWPRCAEMYRDLQKSYIHDAECEDNDAELRGEI